MATRQQLRGDGSKEYQIITNLSRGINNAVADDVLVDNAFRDVVNFSSDQLGNISKRDNLINSNFKEFIRKLAYGDFDLNLFKIKHYQDYEAIDGYKRYSFGAIDQVILQNFYEAFFTNKHYLSNTAFTIRAGVTTDGNSELVKVPTSIGAPTTHSDYDNKIDAFIIQQLDTDQPIKDYTNRQLSNIIEIRNYQYGTNVVDAFKYEEFMLSWKNEETDEFIPINSSSIPNGWTLKDEFTLYKKYIFTSEPSYYIDDLILILNDDKQTEVKTSVVFYTQTSTATNYTLQLLIEENDNSYDFYLYNVNVEMLGVNGDYGWETMSKTISSQAMTVLHKNYLKTDIKSNTMKNITVLGKINVDVDYAYDYTLYFNNIDYIQNPEYYRHFTYLIDSYNTNLNKVYIVEQNNFFKQLQNLDKLFKEGSYSDIIFDDNYLEEPISFEAWFIGLSDYKAYPQSSSLKPSDIKIAQIDSSNSVSQSEGKSICLYKFRFELDTDYNLYIYINSRLLGDDVLIASTFANTLIGNQKTLIQAVNYMADPDVLYSIFVSRYINSLYITTGISSIIEIDLDEADASNFITYIAAFNGMSTTSNNYVSAEVANIYYPVPYEVNNPGFNLLAANPLTAIEMSGNVDNIRGVFYTMSGRLANSIVVQEVPCNIPFYIHVISTGSAKPNAPQIRPNNGELDEEKNPYTTLPGSWESTAIDEIPIYKCTGIDNIESYEMKITKGDDEYLTYFTPAPYVEKEGNDISYVRNTLLSCPRSKIINNQLLLFGNSGYIFFSDFDNFKYFPNYYYVYVPTDINEKVIDIVYFRQYYAVFTNKRIFRMSGDFAADNFEIGPLNDFMGCVNHNTIRQVYNSLYFIGYNGIYSLNQGYLGTGTENLKRVDTQLVNTFNFDNVDYCYVMGSVYIIIMKDGKTWYTYDVDNDMFLRYDYSLEDNSTLSNISFIETLEENQIYAILATNKEGRNYADDLLLYNFPLAKDVNYDYKDSDQGYISSFETPYINLGTPTNTKKFKNLFIKMYNETDSLIPLYVTVYVDDILAITPEDYTIELDEDTNTYFYYFKVDNNAELLKAHNVLGELTLGKDTLGDNIIQQLKLKINAKGRAIKIILADGYDYPNKDNSAIIKYRNNKKFSISTIGIVYKLKKVKEG